MDDKPNYKALLPIGVFLVLYLGLGILFEYVLKISMGFYNIPIVVIFLIALLVACLQNPKVKLDEKFGFMAKGVGDKNIVIMILIFMVAGVFVGVVSEGVTLENLNKALANSNYVTNSLCSILCNSYYAHVLETLYNQIALSKTVRSVILTELRGNNPIEKLAYILKDNSTLQTAILAELMPMT